MKKVMKLELPKNSELLELEEMLQNESGWYINFNTGEVFITYRDINRAINWTQSIIEKMSKNSQVDTEDLGRTMKRNMPPMRNDSMSGGIGIRINDSGFQIFQLDGKELELANSNSMIF